MRILSQDGKIDIPYEMIGISINHKDEKEIIAYPVMSRCRNGEYWRMARYSTKEKTKRVMEMLRNEYYGYKTEKHTMKEQNITIQFSSSHRTKK